MGSAENAASDNPGNAMLAATKKFLREITSGE